MDEIKKTTVQNNWNESTIEPVFICFSVEETDAIDVKKEEDAYYYKVQYYESISSNNKPIPLYDGLYSKLLKVTNENNNLKVVEYAP